MELTRRKGVAPPLERIFTIAELDTQGRTCQLQRLAVDVFEIARVVIWHFIDLIAMNNHNRRILPAGMGVAHLDAATARRRRRVALERGLEPAVECGGGNPAAPAGAGFLFNDISKFCIEIKFYQDSLLINVVLVDFLTTCPN